MRTHLNIAQGTPEWKALRAGKITASEAAPFFVAEPSLKLTIAEIKEALDSNLISYDKKALKPELEALLPLRIRAANTYHSETTLAARAALYARKIAERSGAETMDEYAARVRGFTPESLACQRGKELEPTARQAYEHMTGYEVAEVAFMEHDNGFCGCSPDGLIYGADGELLKGLEIKCHAPEKHAYYFLHPDLFESEHEPQVHWSMAITGLDSWDLFGFCPRLPSIPRTVVRSELTERYARAIDELTDGLLEAVRQYNAGYAAQKVELAKRREEVGE